MFGRCGYTGIEKKVSYVIFITSLNWRIKMEQDKELESRIEEVLKAEKETRIPRMTKKDYIIAAVITLISLLGIIGGFFL